MKTFTPFFLFLILLVSLPLASYSQSRFTLSAGAALPIGVFGSDDAAVDGAGGAAGGPDFNFTYSYAFKKNPFGIFGGFDFMVNGLATELKREYVKQFEAMGINNASFTYSKYINVPLTTGFDLNIKLGGKTFLFARMGFAADFLKFSDMVVSVYNESVKISTDTDMKTGYMLGGGFHFNKLTLSANYMVLGKHKIEGTMSSGPYSEVVSGSQKVDVITVTLGIKL